MKTAFGMILFRNFWRKNARSGGCCSTRRKLSFRSARFGREGMTKLKSRLAGANLEADHHRFRFQPHTPDFIDTLLDLIFQGDNVGGGGSAAVHDG